MMIIRIYIFVILCIVDSLSLVDRDYCNDDFFNPICTDNKIILMDGALYGQMQLGKCIKSDLGFLGCQANVLPQFDHECSGLSSCRIQVSKIKANGGCHEALIKYLSASYSCVASGLQNAPQCNADGETKIFIGHKHSYISSAELVTSCETTTKWTLEVESGLRLNVTLINLSLKSSSPTGSLTDPAGSKITAFGSDARITYLMASTENKLHLTLPGSGLDFKIMLEITVFGCPNLTPPKGAWMTRNGDTVEMGCHSGVKTWSMQCTDNQWIGAVGQCGDSLVNRDKTVRSEQETSVVRDRLTMNFVVFAGCSVVIFISSVIFLVGVCILRKKQEGDKLLYTHHDTLLT